MTRLTAAVTPAKPTNSFCRRTTSDRLPVITEGRMTHALMIT
ncbi:hypothetical protein [Streptomyces sp. YIM S03343]